MRVCCPRALALPEGRGDALRPTEGIATDGAHRIPHTIESRTWKQQTPEYVNYIQEKKKESDYCRKRIVCEQGKKKRRASESAWHPRASGEHRARGRRLRSPALMGHVEPRGRWVACADQLPRLGSPGSSGVPSVITGSSERRSSQV